MDAQELGTELLNACTDEANSFLLLSMLDNNKRADRYVRRHRRLVDAAMYAGIAGALNALQRLGYLPEGES